MSMPKRPHKKETVLFLIILMVFAIYSGIFIYKTSFVIDGERYFSLFDDAMVSMRYARNLADGNGLVMNPGERIEGITNPLWTLWMAAVHFLPVPQSKISLIIQITAAISLLMNLVIVRKIALTLSGNSTAVSTAAVFLTAFYLPLINWSLQGMEVGVITLLISCVVWRVMQSAKNGGIPFDIYILLGIGTLIRIDMAVPFLGVWLYLILSGSSGLRGKHILLGGIVFTAFLGGQTLFRLLYYGDIFPNTYYLKMTGYPVLLRLSRGLYVWWKFVWSMSPLLFIVPVVTLVFPWSRLRGLLALLCGLQMLYSIYVGGDAWDDWGGSNRYVAIIMPQFFILLALGLSQTVTFIERTVKKRQSTTQLKDDSGSYANTALQKFLFPALVLIAFVLLNSNSGTLTMRGLFFLDQPPHVDNNKAMVERAILVKHITTPDAKIAVTWAGAIPYFSERYIVDILGKTDKKIARMDMRTAGEKDNPLIFFLPGHLKYDYSRSIGEQKPDAVLQFWGDLNEANEFMAGKYIKLMAGDKFVFLKTGSEHVLWDKFMQYNRQLTSPKNIR